MLRAVHVYAAGLAGVLVLGTYLGNVVAGDGDESLVMPGPSTHAHYQIELACQVCHTPSMGVKQESCNECHAEELERVNDSHPVVKFKDPRNAQRLEELDARSCVTCHREHQPEITRSMAVTLPTDYCYHCHQTIGEERPTHAGLGFDTCATAGCHNFHDNTDLYERFLVDHLDEPDFKEGATVAERDFYQTRYDEAGLSLGKLEADLPDDVGVTFDVLHNWESTGHAQAGVNCTDCHEQMDESGTLQWTNHPDHNACQQCHTQETRGFLEGRHGMRLAQGLSPMTPAQARLPMHAGAAHRELSCVSCHDSHRFDTTFAAAEACLQCHNDEHTRAYRESPHFRVFREAMAGKIPQEAGVSCATCHLPRVERTEFGESFTIVDHNQNNTLRPNDKMVRAVCLNCHGLQFSLNALADRDLINRNFQGRPSAFVESLEMAREEKLRAER